jgi:hypothetical protein
MRSFFTKVRARKPMWDVGAKAALQLAGRVAVAAPATAPQAAWQADYDDDALVDEDELLTEAERAARPALPASESLGVLGPHSWNASGSCVVLETLLRCGILSLSALCTCMG